MEAPPPASAASTPDWIADGLRNVREELASYARTARDFTLHPRRFAEEWAAGTRRALNPVAFFTTALGFLGPALVLLGRVDHEGDDSASSIAGDALAAVAPFGYYLLVGATEHLILRAFGSRRRLRDTCAMALYAGGGPCAVGSALLVLLSIVTAALGGPVHFHQLLGLSAWQSALLVAALAVHGLFLVSLALSLRGLHGPYGIRVWHVIAATLGALLATALMFGYAKPPGKFGMHLVLAVCHDHDGWGLNVSLID